MTKACYRCRKTLPLAAFNSNGRGARESVCRACRAKRRRQLADQREARTGYRTRATTRADVERRRVAEPSKTRARRAVNHAIRAGKIAPPGTIPCAQADATCSGRHEYHHASYDRTKWLDVVSLCRSHHKRAHLMMRESA